MTADSNPADKSGLNSEAILASATDGYWQVDLGGGRAYLSRRFRDLLGLDAAAADLSCPPLDFHLVHPEDRERIGADYKELLEGRRSEVAHECRLRSGSGWLWVFGRAVVAAKNLDGQPRILCGWVTDISRRKLLEQTLGALLRERQAESLDDFLSDAVLRLTAALGMRHGHIGLLSGGWIETQAVVRDGRRAPNYRYELAGSPCEKALAESVYTIPSGVQSLFPEDQGLKKLGVESYLGIALRSRRDTAMGLLVVMDSKPFLRSEIPEVWLPLLAGRIARELELRQAETALDRQMRHAHKMFEKSINGLGLLREVHGAAGSLDDLLWVEVNPALERRLGATCPQLAGRSILESGDCGVAVLELARSIQGAEAAESQIRRPSGSWFDLRVYRVEPGVIGLVVSDITFRKNAEEAMVESEQRLRGLLANLSLAALILDVEGRVLFANRAAASLVGGREEDILGQYWMKRFLPIDERIRIEGVLESIGGLRNCPPRASNRVLRLDGSERLVEWDIHPITGADGRVEAIAAVGRDITDSKALQERARLAQRMEAVGKLAGGVAHDFNNLLTVINGYVRLASSLAGGGALKNYLAEIERAGEKANELTRQLLALSRRQVLRARDFPAHRIIQSMEPLLARLLGRDVFLDLELGASNDWVHFDPNAIEQMLLVLGSRAREIAPGGGAVRLSTACVMGPLEVHGGVLPESGYFRLRFEDDGPGMSDETILHLFEPFTEIEDGLRPGLELATIYGILSQGGGGVHVESGDWGTRFDLFLPSAPPRSEVERIGLDAGASSVSGAVLLVEDQEQVRLYATDVLRSAGMEVIACPGAPEALAELAAGKDRIAVLVTDVVMLGMSGSELAAQARLVMPQLPIVFMSGYAEAGPSSAELEGFGARFLQKPFTPDQLESAVRGKMGQAKMVRIVVADDDYGVRAFLRGVLEGAGYEVAEAEDGAAAIRALRSHPANVLITDLVMPGQEGIETIRDARKQWPDLRIIAISGAFYGQFLRTAEMLGAKAVLQKPIRPEDLLKCVRQVLEARD